MWLISHRRVMTGIIGGLNNLSITDVYRARLET
jgi:hypothetical protein